MQGGRARRASAHLAGLRRHGSVDVYGRQGSPLRTLAWAINNVSRRALENTAARFWRWTVLPRRQVSLAFMAAAFCIQPGEISLDIYATNRVELVSTSSNIARLVDITSAVSKGIQVLSTMSHSALRIVKSSLPTATLDVSALSTILANTITNQTECRVAIHLRTSVNTALAASGVDAGPIILAPSQDVLLPTDHVFACEPISAAMTVNPNFNSYPECNYNPNSNPI